MLATVKTDLKDNYYDRTFHGIDVDAAFAEAEQRIKAANSVNETVAIIADVLLRLNDSHTTFLPPDRKMRVSYGWEATMIGDEAFVTSVAAGSDAEKKGLAPGDRILFWNRFQPTRQNLWQIYYYYNFVRPQAVQRIIVRKPDGAERPIDVESKLEQRPQMYLEDLLGEIFSAGVIVSDRMTTVGDIFVWRCRAFTDPKLMERGVKLARVESGGPRSARQRRRQRRRDASSCVSSTGRPRGDRDHAEGTEADRRQGAQGGLHGSARRAR